MKRMAAGMVVALAVIGVRAASAEIVDRILAIISGQIITKSDVEAALALGIVEERAGGDRLTNGLQSLIDRVLMLNEVRRVIPREPGQADIDARVAAIRARFPTQAAFTRVLESSGIDASVVSVYAADDLRLAAYLDERFSSASQPTDEEVRQYVQQQPDLAQTGVAGETAAATARRLIADQRRQTLVAAWIAELRRRADLTILGETSSEPPPATEVPETEKSPRR